MNYLVVCLCLAAAAVGGSNASAIPMWEYLSKDEKMSYLYSMFANQVEQYCEFSNMNNCNQELLKYGLSNLKGMPEDHLDSMDPYQRGANNIIWESMMDGHEMMKDKGKTQPSSTSRPVNIYDDQEVADNGLGSQGAGSARIETVYRVPPPKGFIYPSQYRNPVQIPLTGPMVIRVHPDGRPVSEDSSNRMPEDEDLKQYKMSQQHIAKF